MTSSEWPQNPALSPRDQGGAVAFWWEGKGRARSLWAEGEGEGADKCVVGGMWVTKRIRFHKEHCLTIPNQPDLHSRVMCWSQSVNGRARPVGKHPSPAASV